VARGVGKASKEPWSPPKKLACLRCFADDHRCTDDVHDVDVLMDGDTLPYRTRLCAECRGRMNVVVDRGPVNGQDS